VIELRDVAVAYDELTALGGVSLRVADGEWVALIGPNGAGKTTLLRCVAGLVDHAGAVAVGGEGTDGIARRRLAQLVAYVPQQPELPGDMSVADYVLLGRTPHIAYLGSEGAGDRAAAAAVMERLDLTSLAARSITTLSGGEVQRLVLARALAQESPVLLLDEPTSALDLGRRVEVLELVDDLRHERDLTVLSAMHDLTLAGQFADRVVLLEAGLVAATGRPEEVLREDVLATRFGHGVTVLRAPDGDIVVVPRRDRAR
jgi:iron complex transport system ATP-binding protein